MQFLVPVHSIIRWIIIVVAVAALLKSIVGYTQKSDYDKTTRILMSSFSGLMDSQALIGLIFMLASGLSGAGFPEYRLSHTGFLLVAVVAGHLPSRWKEQADTLRYRNNIFVIMGVLALVYIGVATLPGGWTR